MKLLPMGIENFKTMIDKSAYYVDKTNFIEDVLNEQVVSYTRPRRFGKTLNMSMLYYFFSIKEKENAYLFDGLNISKNKDALKHQNKYPTIFISLKEMKNLTFDAQISSFSNVIYELLEKNLEILSSDQLSDTTKDILYKLHNRSSSIEDLKISLRVITNALYTYYQQKVIVLIDEYDVPLQAAYQNNYYEEMVEFLRSVFSSALKTNDALEKGVMTGCLRISKESIFTGLNNFTAYSVLNNISSESFGFTELEVKQLLKAYNLSEKMDEVKEWYDGYRFGKADVYCPWDVLNYCRDLLKDEQAQPKNYWLNTSGNDVIEHFIDSVNGQQTLTKIELERLISGEIVQKEINEFITYKELYNTSENLWSTLFMTGYLTQRGKADGNRYNLVIPNREVRNIITEHILVKFRQDIKKDGQMVQRFCQALANGQAQQVEQIFATYMSKTVSVRDTFVRKAIRENFYHGILLGILSFKDGWTVTSNRESGNGFSDILIQIDDSDIGIVIEVKYTEEGKSMESDCKAALKQIDEKNYTETLYQAGVKRILKYGIACQIKDCKVMLEE